VKAETLQELLAWQPPKITYIIDKGILVPQTKLIIFGRWQTWKSMIAMHTGFCLATGRPWFGYNTVQTTNYSLQIEIPKPEYQKRVAKYCYGNGISSDNIFFRTEYYIKLDQGYGLDDLTKEIEEAKPQVVIIDPIFKIVSGRLTDEYDMRKFMDRMDALMGTYKFALILIHHDRKPQIVGGEIYQSASDIFGTSVFIDWCDTAIRTMEGGVDGEVIMQFEKVRHAEEEQIKPMTIRIDRRNLTFRKVT